MNDHRIPLDSGIAIGPILFIIAILGILAAAIAAGSGSFTSGTTNESNGTKAAALIQIGESLKVGMDRLVVGNNMPMTSVVVGVNNTTNTVDLFSPSGGGVTAPLASMAADPINDIWYYPTAIIPDLGDGATTGLPDRIAMIHVTQGVCDAINGKELSLDTTVTDYDAGAIGDPTSSNNDLGNLLASGKWPVALAGKFTGCINDSSNNTFWYYQVLATQ